MNSTKFPSITVDLERNIRKKLYPDKIPTIKEIMEQYCVSRQTAHKAVKPLIESGMLISNGRGGTRINKRYRHPKLRIGIVYPREHSLAEKDLWNTMLQQKIEADSNIPVLIYLPKQYLVPEVNKLLLKKCHGFIFISSTLTFAVATYLQERNIPFVSCNYSPQFPKINLVDLDGLAAIEKITRLAIEAGYKKITLFIPSSLEGYNDYILKTWHNIKKKLRLNIMPCDNFRFDRHSTRCKEWLRFLQLLNIQKEKPQVIIHWSKISLIAPEQYLIIGKKHKGTPYPPNVIELKEEKDNYNFILSKGYEFLLELLKAPITKTEQRFYEYKTTLLSDIPESQG